MSTRVRSLSLAVALLVLAGCGAADGGGSSAPSTVTSTVPPRPTVQPPPSIPPSTPPSIPPSTPPSTPPTARPPTATPTYPGPRMPDTSLRRLRGVVEAGVENGCLLLTAGGTTYLLLGHTDDLVVGQEVALVGLVQRGVMTTCQQGTPLRVVQTLSPEAVPDAEWPR